ncbi:MAG: hypothetical protein AAB883_01830 [Patescibacteria group bacterium]
MSKKSLTLYFSGEIRGRMNNEWKIKPAFGIPDGYTCRHVVWIEGKRQEIAVIGGELSFKSDSGLGGPGTLELSESLDWVQETVERIRAECAEME